MKKALKLIDIPGLGDTEGIKKDREHIDKIH
jgi:predicted GTPase